MRPEIPVPGRALSCAASAGTQGGDAKNLRRGSVLTHFIQALWTKTIHALDPGFFWTRVYLKQILGGALLADVPCLGG